MYTIKNKLSTLGIYIVCLFLLIVSFIVVLNILSNYNLITKIIFSISSIIVITNLGLFLFLYKKDRESAKHHFNKVIIYCVVCIISFVFEI